jgi:hypothetical protein
MAKNLIELQESAVQEILTARVQTKASCMYGMTILNRSRRTIGKIRRQYVKGLATWDIPPAQHHRLWRDVCDMAELEDASE